MDITEFHLPLNIDIYGLCEKLMENTNLSSSELIELGLFLYHPDIFISLPIESVKLWIFLDKNEQRWLSEISMHLQLSEEKVLLKIIELNKNEKTIYH
ncbi:MAG: hypothetical protein ACW99A_01060 [Candidatus Kariarchaeaceae archaeon]|jgi:hypothetical protein